MYTAEEVTEVYHATSNQTFLLLSFSFFIFKQNSFIKRKEAGQAFNFFNINKYF